MQRAICGVLFVLVILLGSACNMASGEISTETEIVLATDTATTTNTVTFTHTMTATATDAAVVATTVQSSTPPDILPTMAPAASSAANILGQHQVRVGETYYCIGRAYGVEPGAIQSMNENILLSMGTTLDIPAIQWFNIPPGIVCTPQFVSPFPPGIQATTAPSLPTITPIPTILPTTTQCIQSRVRLDCP